MIFRSTSWTSSPCSEHLAPQLNVPIAELKNLPLEQQWDRIAELADKANGPGIAEIRRLATACKAHLRALALP